MVPRVTVIIPVYNGARTIRRAIASVVAQGLESTEVVIVDDGSTDETAKILKEYSHFVRVISQENRGLSAARNAGVSVARGDFVAFLDADDEWLPGKVQRQLAVFERNPSLALVSGGARWLTDTGQVEGVCRTELSGRLLPLLFYWNPVNVSSAMVRRSSLSGFEEVFSTRLRLCEDWHLWIRLAARYPFHVLPDLLVNHYATAGGMSRNRSKTAVEAYRLTYQQMFSDLLNDPEVAPILRAHWRRVTRANSYRVACHRCTVDPIRGRVEVIRVLMAGRLPPNWKTGIGAVAPACVRRWLRGAVGAFTYLTGSTSSASSTTTS